MSTFFPYRLRCACGHVQVVDLVSGIHITRLPWARQQILDGTFQVFECPACATPTAVTAPTVYTDFDRNQYVAVESRVRGTWDKVRARQDQIFEDSFTHGPAIASEMGVRFIKRCVIGFPALREKLMIWDACLDDLVVEAVKGSLAERLGLGPGDAVFRLGAVLPGGHLTFLRFDAPGAPDVSPPPGEPVLEPLATTAGAEAVWQAEGAGLVARSSQPAPVDAETVLAADYRRCLEGRSTIPERYPWLADEWLVDLYDGRDKEPLAGARRR